MSKPDVCEVCGKGHGEQSGGWITFADYHPLPEANHLELSGVSGIEFFCGQHIHAARVLSHLNSAEAVAQLRLNFGLRPPIRNQPGAPQSFFKRLLMWFGL